jgi:hypothetical protein
MWVSTKWSQGGCEISVRKKRNLKGRDGNWHEEMRRKVKKNKVKEWFRGKIKEYGFKMRGDRFCHVCAPDEKGR